MKRLGLMLLGSLATVGFAHGDLVAHASRVSGLTVPGGDFTDTAPTSAHPGKADARMPAGLQSALETTLTRDMRGSDPARTGTLLWAQQQVAASDGNQTGTFGYSVAVSGSTALIGVQTRQTVYVFTESNGVWSEIQKLTPQGADPNDSFGTAVAIHGNRAVVSGYKPITGDIPLRNAVYVFEENGGVWAQSAKLMAHAEANTERFGKSVAISAHTVLVGAYEATLDAYKPKQGAAYVFTESAGNWNLTQTLSASDARADEQFGMAVALDGDTALIGARQATIDRNVPQQGAAYVFEHSAGSWTQTQKLIASDGGGFGYFFGSSVALSGSTALIGAPNVFGNGEFQGAAYVFNRSDHGWTHTQKLISRNGQGYDQFGYAVALSGSTALVGAYGRRIGNAYQHGAAFAFTEADGRWSQTHAFVDDSVAMPGAHYGWAVALEGPTAVIGAHLATVNGNSLQGKTYFYTSHVAATAALGATSLRFRLEPGETGSKTLDIANTGDETLDYAINESAGVAVAVPLNPPHHHMAAANEQTSPVINVTGMRGPRNAAPWLAALHHLGLAFHLDDGSYEDSITLNHNYDEAAAIWLNRFSAPLGTGSFTLDSISILWPENENGSLLGKQINLIAYYDADRIGDPGRAVRLGADHLVTVESLDSFIDYAVDFRVPGDGDIYVGFENSYARGDSWPQLYPAALDTDSAQGQSWLAGRAAGDPDLGQLDGNDYLGAIESFGTAGNWLIRATGNAADNDCVAVADVAWLNVTPVQGSIAPNTSQQVSVTANAANLEFGDYSALLCITSNDPGQSLIRVPVSLRVAEDDTIFRDGFDTSP